MRPRVFPAEDSNRPCGRRRAPKRFNEAAGIPRGRRDTCRGRAKASYASMRSRVFPAEDVGNDDDVDVLAVLQ